MGRTKQAAPQRIAVDPPNISQSNTRSRNRKRSAAHVAEEDAQLERRRIVRDQALAVRPKAKWTLPSWARFPLVLIMNMCLSSAMYSVSAPWMAGELAFVSKKYEGWTVLTGLLTWRGVELGLGWFGDYDSYDLMSLVIVQSFPPLYLLNSFYNVSSTTAITSVLIDALATYIPFRVLRPISAAHKISSVGSSSEEQVPNKEIVTDHFIQALVAILAAGIYSTTLYASYATFLPTTLVTYFNNIPSIAPAQSSTSISLLPKALLLGSAARSFMFTPAIALPHQEPVAFDPVTATFLETIWYNLWGWSAKTKMIIKRTALSASVIGMHTYLQVSATIADVEPTGAAIYSSVWAAAQLLVGLAFGLVGDV